MTKLVLTAASLFFALPAYASEGEKMAVPQFDPSSYASQLFWLLVTFAVLYVLMAKVALPKVGFVIEQRAARIEQDVAAAKVAAAEATGLQESYEASLVMARAEARERISAANTTAVQQQTATYAKQNADLVSRLQTAEANIAAARKTALANITPAAVATAATALQKLTDTDVDGARLATAIDAALKKGA